MIQIISPGLRYGGAPLDVGQTRRFDPATEASMVATGNAIFIGDAGYGSVLVLAQRHIPSACPADTNENTLWSYMVPGGLMGPDDTLEIYGRASQTNSANNKSLRIRAGGTQLDFVTGTTSTANAVFASLSNRGSLVSQVGGRIGSSASTGLYCVAASIDTRQPFAISITGQLANASESLSLESVVMKLSRAARNW